MGVKQQVVMSCDVCLAEQTVAMDAEVETLNGWYAVRQQTGAQVVESHTCGAGCLLKLAQKALASKVG